LRTSNGLKLVEICGIPKVTKIGHLLLNVLYDYPWPPKKNEVAMPKKIKLKKTSLHNPIKGYDTFIFHLFIFLPYKKHGLSVAHDPSNKMEQNLP
jgi:hypothetical protein